MSHFLLCLNGGSSGGRGFAGDAGGLRYERRFPFIFVARSDSVGCLLPLVTPREDQGEGEPGWKPRKGIWESGKGTRIRRRVKKEQVRINTAGK